VKIVITDTGDPVALRDCLQTKCAS
jgi:hypothetical protein